MSIQFDEEAVTQVRRKPAPQSILIRLVLKSKLAKTEKGAQYVLLAIGLGSLAAAFLIFLDLGTVASSAPSPVPSAQWPN